MTGLLSKSRYMIGLQCEKRLWVHCHEKERLGAVDAGTAFRLAQGHEVGRLALELHPEGIGIEWEAGMEEAVRQTAQALTARQPLFEGAFRYEDTYARADVLLPAPRGKWDLVEVKSTTEVKDEHLEDVAFQRQVYDGAGLRVRRCFVQHVNREYVRQGAVEPEKLFVRQDVTEAVEALASEVPHEVKRLAAVLAGRRCPKVEVGEHCTTPHPCELVDECWAFLPEGSVYELWRGRKKARELHAQGILALEAVPKSFALSAEQAIQVAAAKAGKPRADLDALRGFLGQLEYPLTLLDFETVGTAIPLYDGCRPYEQVPFQYALLVQRSPGGPSRRHGFLAAGREDPRPRLLESLRRRIGECGSIVAFNAAFEIARLKACAEAFPEHATWIAAALPRFVDLWTPFRCFHYYHPAQEGSTSQKAVLPALAGGGYADLEIGDGQTAAVSFLECTFGKVPGARRRALREALRVYCRRDVDGMREILWALEKLCRGKRGSGTRKNK
ncbi:MAG: DUF2779 domain-containing protein [Deltaproteobacteria bacterium]|nr:DUF2779 domain-containing protein [Deltaproteobacteria bacterium]